MLFNGGYAAIIVCEFGYSLVRRAVSTSPSEWEYSFWWDVETVALLKLLPPNPADLTTPTVVSGPVPDPPGLGSEEIVRRRQQLDIRLGKQRFRCIPGGKK
jgi:hypothetical protein